MMPRRPADPPDRWHFPEEARPPLRPLLAYLAAFFGAWTGWVLYAYPRLLLLGPETLGYALANLAGRSVLWVVPVLLYVRYIDRRRPLEFLRLVHGWRRGIGVGLLASALNFAGSVARFGLPQVHGDAITWNTILSTSLAIGFIEEVPFRGFLLQKLAPYCGWPLANAATATLFVLFHVPGWLSLGTFRASSAIVVFGLGLAFGVAFRISGSLWSAVIAHSTNDFFAVVLFGR